MYFKFTYLLAYVIYQTCSSSEPPFWPPKDFALIVHFKCPTVGNGPPVVSLLLRITAVQASLVAARVPERIVGAQGNYKKWGPYYRLCEGGLGACPQEMLRFYML